MSNSLVKETLKHLEKLVSFDTQNPPRQISCENPIFKYLMGALPDFSHQFYDAGDGCISLLSIRGTPEFLFNFHIDTVPANKNWTLDPFKLTKIKDKVYGLGACDIKGATACALTAASITNGSVAILFSSDEEHGTSRAIKHFLSQNKQFNQVVVAEPTRAKVALAHRGVESASVQFKGIAGHGSEPRAIDDNAIHQAAIWSSNVIDWLKRTPFSFENLVGLPLNLGKIEGGIKANMIADECTIDFGFRPLPNQCSSSLFDTFLSLAQESKRPSITKRFSGPPLPAHSNTFEAAINKAKAFASQLKLPVGEAVNFWTEASLFSKADYTAIVFGPGDIAQAHTVDEWVAIQQLDTVANHYLKIFANKTQSNSEKAHG